MQTTFERALGFGIWRWVARMVRVSGTINFVYVLLSYHIKHILGQERKIEEPEVDLEYAGLITSGKPCKNIK
jgi:hypothetical protein